MENLENNKIIARYLGYEYFGVPNNEPGWRKSTFIHLQLGVGIGRPYLCRKHRDLEFDTNWNWLMFIVEEINKSEDISIEIYKDECKIFSKNDGYIFTETSNNMKLNVFNVVLKYITSGY